MADLPPSAGALVTDVHVRSPLHGMRALGRAGIAVVALAERRAGAGLWSRYAGVRAVAPPARSDPEGFRRVVAGLAAAHRPLVVFPGNEAALDALLAGGSWLPGGTVLASPGAPTLDSLRDKAALATSAAASGLRVPGTVAVGTPATIVAGPPLPAPCVVKPVRPNQALATAQVVATDADLASLVKGIPADEPLLVQEYVPGPLMAVSLVLDRHGEVVARFQQQALRTSPPDAGVSALAVSVPADDELVGRAAALLRSAGFWGLAQLQFLAGGGRPALIDVNPRFFGSLSLASKAGAGLAEAWHAVARGTSPGPPPAYRVGVRYRWLEAELGLARRRGPSALRPVRRPVAGGIWAGDDPVPSALLALEAVTARIPGLRRG